MSLIPVSISPVSVADSRQTAFIAPGGVVSEAGPEDLFRDHALHAHCLGPLSELWSGEVINGTCGRSGGDVVAKAV